jgi:hypothetical protein
MTWNPLGASTIAAIQQATQGLTAIQQVMQRDAARAAAYKDLEHVRAEVRRMQAEIQDALQEIEKKQKTPNDELPLPSRMIQLDDGTTGYYARRHDDCWTAAVATALQIPIGELPDPRLDYRLEDGESPEDINRSAWQEFGQFLDSRGLHMSMHRNVPVPMDRWVGVVELPGDFCSHSLVMDRGDVIFDPSFDMFRPFDPVLITRGYSFTNEST